MKNIRTMKKPLLLFITLLLSLSTFGQSDYSRGFQNGYKVGYCYNDYGCIPPIPPITPIPRIGESQDNYQDGYNRGFKQGLEDKQVKKPSYPNKTETHVDYSAPVLQDTYNPVEFVQHIKDRQFQIQKELYEQRQKNTAEGMKKYSLEIEGWEDQIGYNELIEKINTIQDVYLKGTKLGMNLISPSTSDELKLYEFLNDAMDDVKYKYSVWQSQKNSYRAAEKIIIDQIIKNESERTINIDSTRANMRTLLNTPGILNRSKITENLIVPKRIVPISGGAPYSSTGSFKETGSFTDSRDGQTYKTVKIGTQVWMAENLKCTKYNDGTSIPLIINDTTWSNLSTPGYCWYDNDGKTFKNTYGALYNWYAINTGKICPTGWHVPTDAEWTTLTNYLGGENMAGGKLKESGTTNWVSPNTAATNETGFTALPGAHRGSNGKFFDIKFNGSWWSSTESNTDPNNAYRRDIYSNHSDVGRSYGYNKTSGLSVRCVMDY